ncbi:hypothetical protein BHE74_00058042 [Ensete ventricosum]|nr:hypothetical protein BHE74_00058042 [Ensete ventricosum]
MAWLPTRGVQDPCKGRPLVGAASRKGPPPAGTASCGQSVAASPQGVAARRHPCHQQGRRRRPQGWSSLGRAVVGRKGQPPPA